MAKKKTTKPKTNEEASSQEDERPLMVRRPGDGSRMLSAEEVAELDAAK